MDPTPFISRLEFLHIGSFVPIDFMICWFVNQFVILVLARKANGLKKLIDLPVETFGCVMEMRLRSL